MCACCALDVYFYGACVLLEYAFVYVVPVFAAVLAGPEFICIHLSIVCLCLHLWIMVTCADGV